MTKKRDRRAIVIPPDRGLAGDTRGLGSQSWSYYQSFMLLRDAASQEASRGNHSQYSRFIPSAIIILHAYVDAEMNERIALAMHLNASRIADEAREAHYRIMRKPLSSISGKPEAFATFFKVVRPFSQERIDALDAFCDLRDILFHTEPQFLSLKEFPTSVEKACRRAGIPFGVGDWTHHASDFRMLKWTYQTVRNYFAEFAAVTGSWDPIERTQGGQRFQYRDTEGNISYGDTLEEQWNRFRPILLPGFYDNEKAE